jgi:hypothetical protein
LQQAIANAASRNTVALANEGNRLSAGQFNIDAALRASLANQQAGMQAAQWNNTNNMDFARMGIEGMLGMFNAQTGRMNAETAATNANQAGVPMDYLNARQYLAGASAATSSTGSTYRPLGIAAPRTLGITGWYNPLPTTTASRYVGPTWGSPA